MTSLLYLYNKVNKIYYQFKGLIWPHFIYYDPVPASVCVYACVYSRVPVLFGDPVQAGEHDGEDDVRVLLDKTHNVFVIPVVQRSLSHLHTHTFLLSTSFNSDQTES